MITRDQQVSTLNVWLLRGFMVATLVMTIAGTCAIRTFQVARWLR